MLPTLPRQGQDFMSKSETLGTQYVASSWNAENTSQLLNTKYISKCKSRDRSDPMPDHSRPVRCGHGSSDRDAKSALEATRQSPPRRVRCKRARRRAAKRAASDGFALVVDRGEPSQNW